MYLCSEEVVSALSLLHALQQLEKPEACIAAPTVQGTSVHSCTSSSGTSE